MVTLPKRTWREQYLRMKRSYDKLKKDQLEPMAYEDDLLHFFMDCWHLKDWVRKDPDVPSPIQAAVKTQVESDQTLRIAADLANGAKHFDLSGGRKRVGAELTGRDAVWPLGSTRLDFSYTITLDDGSRVIAEEIAATACAAWDTILNDNGLAL